MSETARRSRAVKAAFAGAALLSVLAGLLLYRFAEDVGLDPGAAELIAVAFLAVGVADTVLLLTWDRIFRSK